MLRSHLPATTAIPLGFTANKYYRKLGCEMANEPLGTSHEAACGDDAKGGRAATLNALFDEWNDQRRDEPYEQKKSLPALQDGEGAY